LTNYGKHYFEKRLTIENKHYHMVSQWINFFDPDAVFSFGCGPAHYLKVFHDSDIRVTGVDNDKWVVNNCPYPEIKDNILCHDGTTMLASEYGDLVIAMDVLEHFEEVQLKPTLELLYNTTSKWLLVSVPVLGDPCLENDETHKIFKTEEWWIKQIVDVGFEQVKTPEWFMFHEQLYIFKKIIEEKQ